MKNQAFQRHARLLYSRAQKRTRPEGSAARGPHNYPELISVTFPFIARSRAFDVRDVRGLCRERADHSQPRPKNRRLSRAPDTAPAEFSMLVRAFDRHGSTANVYTRVRVPPSYRSSRCSFASRKWSDVNALTESHPSIFFLYREERRDEWI